MAGLVAYVAAFIMLSPTMTNTSPKRVGRDAAASFLLEARETTAVIFAAHVF